MAVRKIRPNYGSVTGLVADDQLAHSTGYESSLERDFIKHLIFNQNVLKHEEQPLTIEFTDTDGKPRRYTPDLLVFYQRDTALTRDWRPLLAEVKYRSDLFKHWIELKPRFRAARAYAKKHGWDFAIITERELRTPYLKNITFLLEFRKYPRDEVGSQLSGGWPSWFFAHCTVRCYLIAAKPVVWLSAMKDKPQRNPARVGC